MFKSLILFSSVSFAGAAFAGELSVKDYVQLGTKYKMALESEDLAYQLIQLKPFTVVVSEAGKVDVTWSGFIDEVRVYVEQNHALPPAVERAFIRHVQSDDVLAYGADFLSLLTIPTRLLNSNRVADEDRLFIRAPDLLKQIILQLKKTDINAGERTKLFKLGMSLGSHFSDETWAEWLQARYEGSKEVPREEIEGIRLGAKAQAVVESFLDDPKLQEETASLVLQSPFLSSALHEKAKVLAKGILETRFYSQGPGNLAAGYALLVSDNPAVSTSDRHRYHTELLAALPNVAVAVENLRARDFSDSRPRRLERSSEFTEVHLRLILLIGSMADQAREFDHFSDDELFRAVEEIIHRLKAKYQEFESEVVRSLAVTEFEPLGRVVAIHDRPPRASKNGFIQLCVDHLTKAGEAKPKRN